MPLKDAGILFENEDEYSYPAPISTKLDQLLAAIGSLPEWAHQLSCAMPNSGFEPCSYRWTDGLDEILYSIKQSKYIRTMAGHCGDVPSSAYNRIIKMLSDAGCNTDDEKQKACFNGLKELLDSRLTSHGKMKECYQNNNSAFAEFFKGENAERLITTGIGSPCGFRVPDIIETLIQHIGGKDAKIDSATYNCLASFQYATDSDWERIGAMIGIMHGIKSFLKKSPLPAETAFHGYAKRALDCLSASKADALVVEFLALHFFGSLNSTCSKVLNRFGKHAPAGYDQLPELFF
ncbi:MAG: hypothetical protein JXR97_16960 [Planctomycetes bacterium]|nr:hypothetical protein [Planctomycetota bacterium]